jgi:aspartate/methionine/tyrosine aminotransferase
MGVKIPRAPEGTFYVWGDVGRDGFKFFRDALKKKVITVPGEFFDVNPRKHRTAPSRYKNFVRFSYGAPMATVEKGLDRLAHMRRLD